MDRRRLRIIVAAAVVGVVAWPGVLASFGHEADGYPLSTYPMFTRARPEVARFHGAVVVAADGSERRLGPRAISGSDEPLQAVALVRTALDRGATAELCAAIRRRGGVGANDTVVLIAEDIDTVGFYDGGREPPRERAREVACRPSP